MSDDSPSAPHSGLPRVPPPPAGPRTSAAGELDLQPDDLIDARYRVKHAIGEGGVGRVYRALQVKLGRDVAVKVLQDLELSNPTHRPRFEREAMALASLSHPNIVGVQDYGVWRGRPFLVMEMLEGQSLRERLDQGPLSEREALRITRELLYALAYAHNRGVVHRDLKPANIFLQSFPTQPDHVKVLDFGFAKFVGNSAMANAPALTQAGTTMGTPPYMAPERLYGSEVDGRSDLYSVGILLFEMLSAQKPFDGELNEILRAHLSEPVPTLAERCPGLGQSDQLTALFERALAKTVEERFPDAAAMLSALDALPSPATHALDGSTAGGSPVLDRDQQPTRPVHTPTVPRRKGQGALAVLEGLTRRLPSKAQWRRAILHAWRTLQSLARRGYALAEPRVRRGAGQLVAQAKRLRDRGGKSTDAHALPEGADEAAKPSEPSSVDPRAVAPTDAPPSPSSPGTKSQHDPDEPRRGS